MSTSFLYHAYGISCVQYKSTEYHESVITYKTEIDRNSICCPRCHSKHFTFKGKKMRKFRMVPFGRKKCFLEVLLHRGHCLDCKKIWWPSLPFMCGVRRMVKGLFHYICDLLQMGTINDVANHLGISWGVVKIIHKMVLRKEYKHIDISEIEYIGIDEFSLKKGHEYMTIFIDLKTGRIVHAVEGKDGKAIQGFLKRIKTEAPKLKAIAMDMSTSYIAAVKETLPGTDIVFDRFHVQALMSKAIDDIRRKQQGIIDPDQAKIIKGCRYVLLRNYENLLSKDNERLLTLLSVNAPLYTAYTLKEQLRVFWEKKNLREGAAFLISWIMDAFDSGILELKKVADTLMTHHVELLNYFKHGITNGKTEGINNKIKTLKRQAYGYRDLEYFKLRLYHLHKSRYAFL
jgi:transposase